MSRVRSVDLGSLYLASLEGMGKLVFIRHGEQAFVADLSDSFSFRAIDPSADS